jgi:hypothetical protein
MPIDNSSERPPAPVIKTWSTKVLHEGTEDAERDFELDLETEKITITNKFIYTPICLEMQSILGLLLILADII